MFALLGSPFFKARAKTKRIIYQVSTISPSNGGIHKNILPTKQNVQLRELEIQCKQFNDSFLLRTQEQLKKSFIARSGGVCL